MINLPKGTKDVLPIDSFKWQQIEKTARETASLFGAKEIRTPTFEYTEVFARGVGDTTDIVNKEMYTFLDKGDRSITLKPEGTAGVARAFVESGLTNSALPSKLYYITQCFRYERPQAGRLREFHQFGVEFLGSYAPDIDAEVIMLAKTFLDNLSIKNYTLYINNIGCRECRTKYHNALREYLKENFEKLCPLCKDRFDKNPLRILDCKNPDCKEIVKNAPSILDYVCDDCKNHFEKVKAHLLNCGIDFKVDDKIVRGLDYYTKTVFEFVSDNIGAQGTICGGGRYDGLIEQFGGGKIPGVGFAVGLERLLMLMEACGVKLEDQTAVKVYLAPMGEKELDLAFKICSDLRRSGISCDLDHMQRGIKSQFKYADKIKAKFVGVIGSTEYEEKVVKFKNMATGEEQMVAVDGIVEYFTK